MQNLQFGGLPVFTHSHVERLPAELLPLQEMFDAGYKDQTAVDISEALRT